jgi:hypothetical protein
MFGNEDIRTRLVGWTNARSTRKPTTGNFVVLFLFFMITAIQEGCLGVRDAAREVRGGEACQRGETWEAVLIIAAQNAFIYGLLQ